MPSALVWIYVNCYIKQYKSLIFHVCYQKMSDNNNFWTTLPGILTGIAGIITATATLLGVIQAMKGPETPVKPEDPVATTPQYPVLKQYLQEKQWKKADKETNNLIRSLVYDTVTIKNIENIPCKQLNEIDRLWLENSKNHFGFTVQKNIWQTEGRNTEKFREKVSWKNKTYDELTFSLGSRPGHLPSAWPVKHEYLFPRIEYCQNSR